MSRIGNRAVFVTSLLLLSLKLDKETKSKKEGVENILRDDKFDIQVAGQSIELERMS